MACNRAQKVRDKKEKKEKSQQVATQISSVKFYNSEIPDVSYGPHKRGSPLNAGQKQCILNLFQSFINEGMDTRQARIQTATRLQFSEKTVTNTVKEQIAIGNVSDNCKIREQKNAYEKLAEEEVEAIRKMVIEYYKIDTQFIKKPLFWQDS